MRRARAAGIDTQPVTVRGCWRRSARNVSRKLEIRNRKARDAARRHAKSHSSLRAVLNVTWTAWRVLWRLALVLAFLFAVVYWLVWRFDLGGF